MAIKVTPETVNAFVAALATGNRDATGQKEVDTPFGVGRLAGWGGDGVPGKPDYVATLTAEVNGVRYLLTAAHGWESSSQQAERSFRDAWRALSPAKQHFIVAIFPDILTKAKADVTKVKTPDQLYVAATKRAIRLGLVDPQVCPRCGGSGRHSYNETNRDTCFGCSGSGKVIPKITREVIQKVIDQRKMQS